MSNNQPFTYSPLEELLAKFFLKGLIKPLAALPVPVRVRIGRAIGSLIPSFATKESTIAKLQLEWILPEIDADKLVPKVFANMAEVGLLSLNLKPLLDNVEQYITCPEDAMMDTLTKRGRPVVCLCSHLGNWEMMAAYVIKRGISLATVARQARNKYMQYALMNIRRDYGLRVLWKQDKGGLKELLNELVPGKVLAALIDQDTDVRSEFVPFFGHKAKTPVGLVELGIKKNATFVTSFIAKGSDGRYILRVNELPDELNALEILKLFHSQLEEQIRRYPDQWVWSHKRWRSGVLPNQTLSSTNYINYLKSVEHIRKRSCE